MAPRSWWLLCALLCSTATPVVSRAGEAAAPKRLAVFLFEKGSPDRDLVGGFLKSFSDIDSRSDAFSVVHGADAGRRADRGQADAAAACGADLRCISAIGEKAGATHVLLGRAAALPDGTAMQWLLIDVGTAGIVGKVIVKFTDDDGASAAAARVAREMLGVDAASVAPRPVAAAPICPAVEVKEAPRPQPSGLGFWHSPRVVAGAVAFGALLVGGGVYFAQSAHAAPARAALDPLRPALRALATGDRGAVDGRASLLLAAGGALAAGGVAWWGSESSTVSPVIATDGTAGVAGVSVAW